MTYRIKTVARLTGVPRNTLLAWERRYAVVNPGRADNGYREYSDEDLATLTSVKQLIDRGYRISEAVQLVQEANESGAVGAPVVGASRVAILHGSLVDQIQQAGGAEGLTIVRAVGDLVSLGDPPLAESADVLVADLTLLGDDPRTGLRDALEAVDADSAVVLYTFAPHAVVHAMVQMGARLVRWPARAVTVLQTVRSLLQLKEATAHRKEGADGAIRPRAEPVARGEAPGRVYTDSQLARLQERTSAVECECPNHLSALVSSLVAFEAYSLACKSKNDEDAVMHAFLHQKTAEARRVIEDALVELVAHEGLEV